MPEEWNSSELLYQSVLDALPEGILYCDTNYIVRKVNQCYASLLGGDPLERAVGRMADVVYSVLEKTTSRDQRELALVAAQDDLVEPRFHFEVTQIS